MCNIYDLEGNYYEVIAEKNSYYNPNKPYVWRGGGSIYSSHTKAASDRWYTDNSQDLGQTFRFVLYVLAENIEK